MLELALALASLAPSQAQEPVPSLEIGVPFPSEIVGDEPDVETDLLLRDHPGVAAPGKSFRIEVGAEGLYTIELRAVLFDGYLVLRDEDGHVLAEDDDKGIGLDARIGFWLRPDVPYRLDACATHAGRGPFELELLAGVPDEPSPADRSAAERADLEQRMILAEERDGPRSAALAVALNGMGRFYFRHGDIDGATTFFERACAMREDVLGPDHPDTATMLGNLGVIRFDHGKGDLAAARELLERALAVREKVLGARHFQTATNLGDLGVVLSFQGDLDGARSRLERALAIQETLDPHENTRKSLDNLADLLRDQGESEAARELLERALDVRRKVYGPRHHETAKGLFRLASVLFELGEVEASRSLQEEALSVLVRNLPADHPDLQSHRRNLATVTAESGDVERACELLEIVLAAYERTLPPTHADLLATRTDLAHLKKRLGDTAAAEALQVGTVRLLEHLSDEDPRLLDARLALAATLREGGDSRSAGELAQKVLDTRERLLPGDHPALQAARLEMVACLRLSGELDRIASLQRTLLDEYSKSLPDDHGTLQDARRELAATLRFSGKADEALELEAAIVSAVAHEPDLTLMDHDGPDISVTERDFTVKAIVHDWEGIADVRIVQDGAPSSAMAKSALVIDDSGRTGTLTLELRVPTGMFETHLVLRAVNHRGIVGREVRLQVHYRHPQRELYILALGVRDYDQDSLDLEFPTKDVGDLVAALSMQSGVYYRDVHEEILLDADVTAANLKRLRHEFLRDAQPEDTIIVFAAGHGVRAPDGTYFFLTSSSTPEDPYEGLERTLIDSLVTWPQLRARRRLLLLDSCYAGRSLEEGLRGTDRGISVYREEEVEALMKTDGQGVYILCATMSQGFAREQDGNGLFTRTILEALGGAADEDGNGLIEVEELRDYTAKKVQEYSGGQQRPTMPTVIGGENFVLSRVLK